MTPDIPFHTVDFLPRQGSDGVFDAGCECGYEATYTEGKGLEVKNLGDLSVRHVGTNSDPIIGSFYGSIQNRPGPRG